MTSEHDSGGTFTPEELAALQYFEATFYDPPFKGMPRPGAELPPLDDSSGLEQADQPTSAWQPDAGASPTPGWSPTSPPTPSLRPGSSVNADKSRASTQPSRLRRVATNALPFSIVAGLLGTAFYLQGWTPSVTQAFDSVAHHHSSNGTAAPRQTATTATSKNEALPSVTTAPVTIASVTSSLPPAETVSAAPSVAPPTPTVAPTLAPTPTAAPTPTLQPTPEHIDGVRNFRDVADGNAMIKPGLLYRSGELENVTKSGESELQQLLGSNGTILDLRTTDRVHEAPDPTIGSIEDQNLPIAGVLDLAPMVTDPTRRDELAKDLRAAENAHGPVLIHCRDGKDRTGWMVAMIMYTLGANNSQVMKQYLASNQAFPGGVKAAWLDSGLTAIQQHYGSVGNYLKQGVGLTGDDLAGLRGKFGA